MGVVLGVAPDSGFHEPLELQRAELVPKGFGSAHTGPGAGPNGQDQAGRHGPPDPGLEEACASVHGITSLGAMRRYRSVKMSSFKPRLYCVLLSTISVELSFSKSLATDRITVG